MSSANGSSACGTPVPDKQIDMFSYLYPSLKDSWEVDSQLQFNQAPMQFMTNKDVDKLLKVKELQGLSPIILIIYDIVYDLTNYNNHPGGKKILRKYNGTDCTQIFIDIGHNVDSLKYDINWKQCVIGRYVNSGRNNSNSTFFSSSRTNSNMVSFGNRQNSNLSFTSSLYSDSIFYQKNGSEIMTHLNETNMLRKQVIVKKSDIRSNMKTLLKLAFWLLMLVLGHVIFG